MANPREKAAHGSSPLLSAIVKYGFGEAAPIIITGANKKNPVIHAHGFKPKAWETQNRREEIKKAEKSELEELQASDARRNLLISRNALNSRA